jgi:F0F1-type ATP synthase membrane subunit c/vacuolar-type H+-ATPase subunit K
MLRVFPWSPYAVAVPATSVVAALGTTGLGLGTAGIVGGAVLGFAWSIVLGRAVERSTRQPRWNRRLTNGFVFIGIVGSGAMLGGGVMYLLLMKAAAAAPDAVLSAMMQPAIPFFMLLNTPLEVMVVPGAIFANWRNGTRRRLLLVAALAFYALRIWSYLAYVPSRVEIASRALSPEDIEWFHRSLAVDYRPLLVAIVLVAFTATAFVPHPPDRVTE